MNKIADLAEFVGRLRKNLASETMTNNREVKDMNFLTPAEIADACCNAGCAKAKLSIGKMLVLGILAGAYIGFGANLAVLIGHDVPKYLGNGLGQVIFGAVFSVGLMLVVIGGAELFTGNNLFLMVSALDGKISWGDLLRNWTVVWIANFIGSLLLVVLIYNGGTWAMFKFGVGAKALAIANGKLSLTWSQAFFRAILCNWLVCLAVWLALGSKDVIGKIFAIFFPIMAFVASGFEHSVANMFFIPLGILMAQIPDVVTAAQIADVSKITWPMFINANLIPVTLGNIVGGGIFVGAFYWYAYLMKTAPAAETKVGKNA